MKILERFVLCDAYTDRVNMTVWAEIKDSCLKIEGRDRGSVVQDVFGVDEYEYGYDFDKRNTEKLFITLLKHECGQMPRLYTLSLFKKVLLDNYGGMDGCKRLRDFCDGKKIEYQFYNYM